MSTTDSSSATSLRSITLGFVAGVAAYLLGYLLAGVIASGEVSQSLSGSVPQWKAAGWYFYNAHFVDLTSTLQIEGTSGEAIRNLVTASESSSVQFLYVIPPLATILAGAQLSRWSDDGTDAADNALRGAMIVIGYLTMVLVGVIATSHTVDRGVLFVDVSQTIQPQLAPAVVIAGLLYPIVFGAIGGAIASRL